MLPALLALQALTLVVLVVLLLRRVPATPLPLDPRLETLAASDVPRLLTQSDARGEALERALRAEVAQLRAEMQEGTGRTHHAANTHAEALRRELLVTLGTLGETLRGGLDGFRQEHRADAEHLRSAMEGQIDAFGQRLTSFSADTSRHHTESRDALHTRLMELQRGQVADSDRLRATVEERLNRLNEANTAKLEEMRATVDEKLHSTLQSRLTESFGQVTDHLAKVHNGLGEMSKLSSGVEDLSRIFTNVKSRGGFAEVQLGMLLSQMLAPNQFQQNVKVKRNTGEMVEYAVTLPTPQGEVLLPIDAKFPREAWERLETAYASKPEDVASAGKAFEAAIRVEGKRICEKYISPPVTTSFAVMFLPTEGLYAEVMRRDGLQAEIQGNCRVTIAGPSTLSALLNSFQMGFSMLEHRKKGDEVWKVLANARKEFETFETLMGSMERQVGTVQNTIEKLNTRTRAINRSLREVSVDKADSALGEGSPEKLDAAPRTGHGPREGLLPMLVANED